jgi:hypothetical protein
VRAPCRWLDIVEASPSLVAGGPAVRRRVIGSPPDFDSGFVLVRVQAPELIPTVRDRIAERAAVAAGDRIGGISSCLLAIRPVPQN